MPKAPNLDDCVALTLASDGGYYTFWTLREKIHLTWGKYYGEPTISASLRNLRKDYARKRYGFPLSLDVEVVEKRKRLTGKGYEYKLTDAAYAAIKEKMNGR